MFKAVAGYYKDNEQLRLLVKIIAVWLISRAVMLLMVPVMNLIADEPHQWLYYMNPWDAEWYKGLWRMVTSLLSHQVWQAGLFSRYTLLCVWQ